MAETESAAPPLPAHVCKHLIDGKPFLLPDGSPGSERYLHDFPLLPKLKEYVERRCSVPGWGGRAMRAYYVREAVRFFYFEGKHAVYRDTPEGHLVLKTFAYDEDDDVIGAYVCSQPDRQDIGIISVPENDGTEYTML